MRFSPLVAICLCATVLINIGTAADPVKIVSAGEWSKPVADNRGYSLRGRLILAEKPARDELREAVVYVELQDVGEFVGNSLRIYCEMGPTDFRPEHKRGLQCEMRDKDQRPIPSAGYPFGGAVPKSEWVTLPVDATIRVRATPFGIRRAKALAISPHLNGLWEIRDDDPNEYWLSGSFTVDPPDDQKPAGEEHVWRGTILLPAMRIVNQQLSDLHNNERTKSIASHASLKAYPNAVISLKDPTTGMSFYVESDGRRLVGFDKAGMIAWSVDVFAEAKIKPLRGEPAIRDLRLVGSDLGVTCGRSDFAKVDLKTGKTVHLGND